MVLFQKVVENKKIVEKDFCLYTGVKTKILQFLSADRCKHRCLFVWTDIGNDLEMICSKKCYCWTNIAECFVASLVLSIAFSMFLHLPNFRNSGLHLVRTFARIFKHRRKHFSLSTKRKIFSSISMDFGWLLATQRNSILVRF